MNYLFYLFLVFFGFTHVTDGAKFRCDYKYCRYAKAWFKYHVIPAVWEDARLMCKLEGGILASPTTLEIRSTMMKSTGRTPIFTGLHSTFSKGQYFTVDGIPLEEIPHSWASEQPNNYQNSESCLAMDYLGNFADVRCDEPRPYLCISNVTEEMNACGTHDNDYVLYDRTGHCYKFHKAPRNFTRAHFACSAEGGHLAIINSQKEAGVIIDIFKLNPARHMVGTFAKDVALVGIGTMDENGDWRTIHGQTLSEAGYEKWASGEPNNYYAPEYCGTVNRYSLYMDSPCNREFAFICEKKPDYPPVCDNNMPTTVESRRNHKANMVLARKNEMD